MVPFVQCMLSATFKLYIFDYFPLRKKDLNLQFKVNITWNQWNGIAFLPWEYFPLGIDMMNSYAIHESGIGSIYEALYSICMKRLRMGNVLIHQYATRIWLHIYFQLLTTLGCEREIRALTTLLKFFYYLKKTFILFLVLEIRGSIHK